MQIVPVAPIVNGITLVSTFHITQLLRCNLFVVFLGHISIFSNCSAYLQTCAFCIIAAYDPAYF